MKPKTVLMLSLSFLAISQQTVDLNLRQLQFVSNHLTTPECRRLITALYQKSFQLTPKQLRPIKDDEPCLMHLADWNKQTGTEGTVEDLTLRLHQIGRVDIARALAKAVYDETSREVHKFFLDNPFKAMAKRHGSRLMEDDDDEQAKTKKLKAVDNLRHAPSHTHFALAVVAATLTLTFIGLAVMVIYCPASFHTMCPTVCLETYDAVMESVKENLTILKNLTATEAFGMKKEQTRRAQQPEAAGQEEKDRLVQSILAI